MRAMPWRCVSQSRRAHPFHAGASIAKSNIRGWPMPEVKRVIVTIKKPNAATNDRGQTTYGYYTLADGLMTMTDGEGKPMRHAVSGELMTHRMNGEDRELPIA